MKSILNVKKTSNLIKGICSHKICSGIKSQPVKKTICYSVPKTFDFCQNYSVAFHRVTFDHSISCVLLIDKPDESCQKGDSIATAKTNAPISQTSSECLKLTKNNLPFMRLILEEQQKYLQSFINNATYHPM